MRFWNVPGIGLLALAVAGAASAATTVYYQAGVWRAFGGRDPQHRLECGMLTDNPEDGRELEVGAVIGKPGLAFAAAKPSWNMPPGSAIPVVIQADGEVPWTVQGTGAGRTLRWTLGGADAQAFEAAFHEGTEITLRFPSGDEPAWHVSLDGAAAADATFRRCVQEYTAATGGVPEAMPMQPFGSAAGQPYGLTQPAR